MKNYLISVFIFSATIFSVSPSFANEDGLCTEKNEVHGPYIFTRQLFDQNSCFLTVRPSYAPTLIYRSFIFRENGKLLIFNSYGPGDSSKMTGARVFHFFPRQQVPNFSKIGARISVVGAHPIVNIFWDATGGQLSGYPYLNISEDPKIHADNLGGVEIPYFRSLLLDSGFALGSDPTANMSGVSVFRDDSNRKCQVKNSEIFVENAGGDVVFRYSDLSLKKFLTSRCPDISFDF